jgi:Asp-tRNA(Asn)/Glu-tRNA(Gln) amidotransferase A subunit family amidase
MKAAAKVYIDVVELTIAQLQDGYARGRFTAEAVARPHLARTERYEPAYNAFMFLNPAAIDDARRIDAHRAAGEALGPLAGVPVVVKEAIDFVGLPSTIGWAPLSSKAGGVDLLPERDAPVVARLCAGGAVILGKTNIPAFSHDGARANSSWDGPTFNAVDRSIVPGASSSGTATAVAASFAVVGLAEETGGSIQNPAAAQSLVGVKPTFGLVPNTGVAPLAGSTRDVVGPHARNALDAAILLDVLAGYTVEDPKTVPSIGRVPAGGYAAALRADALAGARLGHMGWVGASGRCREAPERRTQCSRKYTGRHPARADSAPRGSKLGHQSRRGNSRVGTPCSVEPSFRLNSSAVDCALTTASLSSDGCGH